MIKKTFAWHKWQTLYWWLFWSDYVFFCSDYYYYYHERLYMLYIKIFCITSKIFQIARVMLNINSFTNFNQCMNSGFTVIAPKRYYKSCFVIPKNYSLNLNQWNSHWLYQWKYINWWISALLWFHWRISERVTWT